MDELTEIRDELLLGVENKDFLYIKMQINKIDTLIYNANKEKKSIDDFNLLIDRLQIASDIKYPDRLWNAAFKENAKMRWSGQYDLLLDRVLSLEEEIKEIIMDIHAKQGTKVIVTEDSIKNGYDCVEKHAREHLKVGKTYTISSTNVNGWNTNVYLEEFPDEVFNSVSFVDIP